MVAIIIGMPIIGIMALVFIGICMAFIMVELPESIGMKCCEWS
jgi:hypothetical protein